MSTAYLTPAAVLLIHDRICRTFGGGRGLRDKGALLSAVARPRATFERRPLYPSLFEKAGALLESLCQNHPFVDGNKRVAYVSAALFLQQNGWTIEAEEDDAVHFMIQIASGKLHKDEIRIWLEEHAAPKS